MPEKLRIITVDELTPKELALTADPEAFKKYLKDNGMQLPPPPANGGVKQRILSDDEQHGKFLGIPLMEGDSTKRAVVKETGPFGLRTERPVIPSDRMPTWVGSGTMPKSVGKFAEGFAPGAISGAPGGPLGMAAMGTAGGLMNMAMGPDPTTARATAETLMNMATSALPTGKVNQAIAGARMLPEFLRKIGMFGANATMGGLATAATDYAGNEAAKAAGEMQREPTSVPGAIAGSAALNGLLSAVGGGAKMVANRLPPSVKNQVNPLLEKLKQYMETPSTPTSGGPRSRPWPTPPIQGEGFTINNPNPGTRPMSPPMPQDAPPASPDAIAAALAQKAAAKQSSIQAGRERENAMRMQAMRTKAAELEQKAAQGDDTARFQLEILKRQMPGASTSAEMPTPPTPAKAQPAPAAAPPPPKPAAPAAPTPQDMPLPDAPPMAPQGVQPPTPPVMPQGGAQPQGELADVLQQSLTQLQAGKTPQAVLPQTPVLQSPPRGVTNYAQSPVIDALAKEMNLTTDQVGQFLSQMKSGDINSDFGQRLIKGGYSPEEARNAMIAQYRKLSQSGLSMEKFRAADGGVLGKNNPEAGSAPLGEPFVKGVRAAQGAAQEVGNAWRDWGANRNAPDVTMDRALTDKHYTDFSRMMKHGTVGESRNYLDKMIDGDPTVFMRALDDGGPELRDAARTRVTEKLLSAFQGFDKPGSEPLSILDQFHDMRKADVGGGTTGGQVLRKVFGNDAIDNIEKLYEALEKSKNLPSQQPKDGSGAHTSLRLLWNNRGPALRIFAPAGLLGASAIASAPVAAAMGTAGGIAGAALEFGPAKLGQMLASKNSKRWNFIVDMAENSGKWTTAQISQYLSGLAGMADKVEQVQQPPQ